ncbi:DUF2283 domain-containing protein [Candidatus Pacearchaeota archaeon CG10_big_fil_rev_8_21_14_0_10_32_14]|nr:MAG: DUF2283 domain-containing protein [Candidatus Pacearchaeota archaeon CG10_big_fil_rev_8_21_14_0_10_32_14]
MKINFDKKHDIMRIKFQDSGYDKSREVDDGIVIDIDKKGKIIAIEILDVSQKMSKESISELSLNN